MKIPAAFQILHSFSPAQLSGLAQFLKSSFFSKQNTHYILLKEWERNRGKTIDRPVFYSKVLPGKKYTERDWYLLMSRFQNSVEQYLIWQELQTDRLSSAPFLARAFRRLQRTNIFEGTINKVRKSRQKRQSFLANDFIREYELEMEYYDYIASHDRNKTTNLQKVTDTLDCHFIAEKLKHACLAHSRFIINQENYNIHYLETVLDDINDRPYLLEIPAISVYYACYKAVVKGGGEEDFRQLRKVINQFGAGFPNAEIRDVYLLAINYCIKAMNESKTGFEHQAFEIYKDSLEKGYLLEDGYMPESTFSNMVTLGIKEKDFKWTANFIQTQKTFLREELRVSLVDFNLAQLFYARGELQAAANALIKVSTKSPFLYLGAKSLQLRVLHEAQEWDALDSTLESLRVYLNRRKDLGYRKTHYKHLHNFFKSFIQLKPDDKAAKTLLREKILQADAFRLKEWFLERL